jgi:hypothetical protein
MLFGVYENICVCIKVYCFIVCAFRTNSQNIGDGKTASDVCLTEERALPETYKNPAVFHNI